MRATAFFPGDAPATFNPGTLLVTHGEHSFVDAAIRFGQRLRMRGPARVFGYWNHVACVVGTDGSIVEMLAQGVELNNASKYQARDYQIVDLDLSPEDALRAVEVWNSMLAAEIKYGFFSIVSIGITLLTNSQVQFTSRETIICSGAAVVGLCSTNAHLPLEWRLSPGFVTPAEVAQFAKATPAVYSV